MKTVCVKEMRELERRAGSAGASPTFLMGEAGRGASELVHRWAQRLPERFRRRFAVVCGRGNNGGDGFKTAADLKEKYGAEVAVYAVADPAEMSEESRCYAKGLDILPADRFEPTAGDVIVDALLGVGMTGELRRPYRDLVGKINRAKLPVASLDCPSGLDCDDGTAEPFAVRADLTVTFGYPKLGFLRGVADKYCGAIRVAPLSVPEPENPEAPELFTERDAADFLAPLPLDAHKKSRAVVGVVGGSAGYRGAPRLSAVAALRAGAGWVQLAAVPGASSGVPLAVVVRDMDEAFSRAVEFAAGCDVLSVGQGWAGDHAPVLAELLKLELPLVLDAEALNLLAKFPALLKNRPDGATTVLTPHAGEMRRLQDGFGVEPVADRVRGALDMASATGAVVVLKGARTVVAAPSGRVAVNSSGSPSLATAGSGDVLDGVIAAMIGKEPSSRHFAAICTAVWLHGLAGELNTLACRSLIADDLPLLVAEALRQTTPVA